MLSMHYFPSANHSVSVSRARMQSLHTCLSLCYWTIIITLPGPGLSPYRFVCILHSVSHNACFFFPQIYYSRTCKQTNLQTHMSRIKLSGVMADTKDLYCNNSRLAGFGTPSNRPRRCVLHRKWWKFESVPAKYHVSIYFKHRLLQMFPGAHLACSQHSA